MGRTQDGAPDVALANGASDEIAAAKTGSPIYRVRPGSSDGAPEGIRLGLQDVGLTKFNRYSSDPLAVTARWQLSHPSSSSWQNSAAKSPEGQRPDDWKKDQANRAFLDAGALNLNLPVSQVYKTVRGKHRGGTNAHWQIALAYAKYLSPAFHMWCNTVVRERMEGKSISTASLPAELVEMIRRTDGISRMLSHNVTEIEKAIPAIVSREIEAAIVADSRRAALNVVSVRQLTEDAGAVKKGRNSVNRKLGYALRDRAAADPDGGKAFRCPHTGVWLFDRAFAEKFMREVGDTTVRAHNDKINGQGVLKLVRPKKSDTSSPEKPTPPA